MFTENEKKVLKLLFTAFEDYSINSIARKCNLAPNGALKILRKFEEQGILIKKDIANIKSYKLNFENEKTKNFLQLALIPELKGRLKFRFDDLKQFKSIAKACIVFGSYIDLKKEPNDLDIMIILDKKKFRLYKDKSSIVFKTIPVKVHDVLQTPEDFKENLLKKDKVIVEILQKGIIFWGQEILIDLVKDGR
mgnify:CR=1 FL=1